MVKTSNPSIRFEMLESNNLADSMNQIRTWLDARKIEPSLFKISNTEQGKVTVEIGFSSAAIATTFQQELAEVCLRQPS